MNRLNEDQKLNFKELTDLLVVLDDCHAIREEVGNILFKVQI